MCSATDSYDIALASEGVDICEHMFDGDPINSSAQQLLDFSKSIIFKDFKLITNPNIYEFSDIDVTRGRTVQRFKISLHYLNSLPNGILFQLCFAKPHPNY